MLGWLRSTGRSSRSASSKGEEVPATEAQVPKLNLLRTSAKDVSRLSTTSASRLNTDQSLPSSANDTKGSERSTRPSNVEPHHGSAAKSVADHQASALTQPSFSSFAQQQARVVMEGRLNKLKGRGIGKSWVPQYFVLKADAFYYTPNKTYSHKEKKVSLVRAKIGTAQHYTKKDHAFGVMDKNQLHIMCAESESLMHEWIKALIAVRTALEGRTSDSQLNPAFALNPRS